MIQEKVFFIQVLADHLSGRNTEPCYDIDWNSVYALSRTHQVDGIVYHQCKAFIPEQVKVKIEYAANATAYQYFNREYLMQEIVQALKKEGIQYFPVKGFSVAQYYPVPTFRTMGDCDVVIPTSDIDRAKKTVEKIGFCLANSYMQHEWTYKKNGLLFELHDVLIREGNYTTKAQDRFFNSYMKYIENGEIDWSFHYLYLLMHLRSHIIKNGAGIRQFMDLAVIMKSQIQLKWDWIESTLKELDLLQFAHACYSLIEKWFGTEIPVRFEALNDEFAEKATEKILTNGVFGFNDNKNANNIEKNSIVMGHTPRWINRIKAVFLSVFLPYRSMRRYPGFEFVDHRIYLMPIAWIHRFGMILRRKDRITSIHSMRKYFIENEELDERKEFLSNMGLR